MKRILSFFFFVLLISEASFSQSVSSTFNAPAPLFRDPITDGAADPVVIWNREESSWWMLYTQRRANVDAADVAFCYGNSIAIASSENHGKSWIYRGTLDLEFERGHNTFWAPDVVYYEGTYHMFVAYIQGVRNHWSGAATMAHFTSKNLWDWDYQGLVDLNSEHVIDATLYQMPNGIWKMWYKDSDRGSITMLAESNDLYNWKTNSEPAIGGSAHEGPKIFFYEGSYWMLTDEWHGMRVYKSNDAETWEKQGIILADASDRPEDTPSGAHGDVLVVNDAAYVFYFTHPGRKRHPEATLNEDGIYPYSERRSSIQVAKLELESGTLVADRSPDFPFYLPDPTQSTDENE